VSEYTDFHTSLQASPIIFGAMAAIIDGPDGGPWEAKGNGADCKGAVETLAGEPRHASAPAAKETGQWREIPGTNWFYESADRTVQFLRVQRIEFQTPDGLFVEKSGKRHKEFRQFRREGNKWVRGGVKNPDKELVLFRLSELLDDLKAGKEIYFVEGEKCVDAVREIGLAATCHAMGGNWRAQYAETLKGANVTILPNHDDSSEAWLDKAAPVLIKAGCRVRVLRLPCLEQAEDVFNWIERGGTREALETLSAKAPTWAPRERLELNSEPFFKGGAQQAEQKPASRVIGAGTFMRSYVPISYTLGGILPSGYLYGLTAKQGSGKTALKIAAALAVAFGREDILGCPVERGRVAYVTIENPVDFKMKLAVNCFVHNISYDEIEPRVAIIDGRDTPEQIFDGLRLDAEANGGFQLACFDTFQAGFAAAGGAEFNDNAAVLKYVISLRPLTTLPGQPSALVAFHPTKNAGETDLIPYGGGSTYNEVDGNLTLWKEATIKLHHNRLRGPEFEPRFFRIEQLSCPAIVDKSGRQILLPVLRPTTAMDVEERASVENETSRKILRALLDAPGASERELAQATGISRTTVQRKIGTLKRGALVELGLNGLTVTGKAKKQLNPIS
jgi:uncharacterized membrane protein